VVVSNTSRGGYGGASARERKGLGNHWPGIVTEVEKRR